LEDIRLLKLEIKRDRYGFTIRFWQWCIGCKHFTKYSPLRWNGYKFCTLIMQHLSKLMLNLF
jgi:hypothetical protein